MAVQSMPTDLRQECDAAKSELVNVALELAITYCRIAAVTKDRAKSRQTVAHAERAYATAVSYLDDDLTPARKSEIKVKLGRFLSLRAQYNGNHHIQRAV